ncbi:hypothetical protein KIPB_016231, partial [Kipferlia bialata]
LYLDLPLSQFQTSDYREGAGNVPLLEGTYPTTGSESGIPVILKEYNTDKPQELEHVRRELAVYSRVQDRHIVPCLGMSDSRVY